MKRTISILSVLAFVLVFSGSIFAQASASNITASADVLATLDATKTQDVNFGLIDDNISGGSEPTISTDGSSSGSILDNTNTAPGYVNITAEGNQTITITVPTSVTLDNQGSSTESLTYTPTYQLVDDVLASDDPATGDGSNGSGTETMPTDGDGTIILGGQLTENSVTGTIDGGSYQSASFTVTIDYQ